MSPAAPKPAALALLVLVAACGGGAVTPTPDAGAPADAGPVVPASPFVHAFGPRLYDGQNRPFTIRGVALGAWLFHESWISLFDYPAWGRAVVEADALGKGAEVRAAIKKLGADAASDRDKLAVAIENATDAQTVATIMAGVDGKKSAWGDGDTLVYRVLEQRFGKAGRRKVMSAFHDAWITEADIQRIAALGFNTVRIAIGWRELVDVGADEDAPAPLVFEEEGFARVSAVLDWCERAGIHGIIDLQDSPGGHNNVSGSKKALYTDDKAQAATIALWSEIARRYKDRTSVAAYSLLAEPYAAPDVAAMIALYKRLYDALRALGDPHVVVIHDGFKALWSLPTPEKVGWEGVMYSTHFFDFSVKSLAEYQGFARLYEDQVARARERDGIPYFVGSFALIADTDWGYDATALYVDTWNKHAWDWSIWTWKRIDDPLAVELFGETTQWGVVRGAKPAFRRPDLHVDDLDTLVAKMATYASANFDENKRLVDTLSPRLK